MTYLIIILLILSLGYYYFFVHRKKVLLDDLSNAINMCKIGLYKRLTEKYKYSYSDKISSLLAGAIINKLFLGNPTTQEAKDYSDKNEKLIENELLIISKDKEICNIITQSIRVKFIIESTKKNIDLDKLLNHMQMLKDQGIFIDGGETPTPKSFILLANKFLHSS